MNPMQRNPPSFPHILINKAGKGKYQKFIILLKEFLVDILLMEALKQMSSYEKFIKN